MKTLKTKTLTSRDGATINESEPSVNPMDNLINEVEKQMSVVLNPDKQVKKMIYTTQQVTLGDIVQQNIKKDELTGEDNVIKQAELKGRKIKYLIKKQFDLNAAYFYVNGISFIHLILSILIHASKWPDVGAARELDI
jgi:hypothetical protein